MPLLQLSPDDDRALQEYSDAFCSGSGIQLPLEYLRASRVWVFRQEEREGTLVWGFVLAPSDQMLWPGVLGAPLELQPGVSLSQMIELNGAWVAREFRFSRESAELWRAVGQETARFARELGAKWVTYAFDPGKTGLSKLYANVPEGVLYDGPARSRRTPRLRVEYASPERFAALEVHCAREINARAAT